MTSPPGHIKRADIQTGEEIKHDGGRARHISDRDFTSQYTLYSVLVSIDVIVHPSGLYRRGPPGGLVDVISDKTAPRGLALDVLIVLKLTLCRRHTKCSVNFRAHVLQMSSRLVEFVGVFIIILTFRSYWTHPLSWHGIDWILFFPPAKTHSESILNGRLTDKIVNRG